MFCHLPFGSPTRQSSGVVIELNGPSLRGCVFRINQIQQFLPRRTAAYRAHSPQRIQSSVVNYLEVGAVLLIKWAFAGIEEIDLVEEIGGPYEADEP